MIWKEVTRVGLHLFSDVKHMGDHTEFSKLLGNKLPSVKFALTLFDYSKKQD